MSNQLFPAIAGLTWSIKPIPTWSTVVQRSRNRATTRLMSDPFPMWTFELSYDFIRSSRAVLGSTSANPGGYSELEQIVGFYNQMGGAFDDFLLDPMLLTGSPGDSKVSGAAIGTGDSTTTTFQLQRNYGGFSDEIQCPVGTVFISVNGLIQTSGWTLGPAGQITFSAAPALNAAITADFRWNYRVRFAEDELGIEGFLFQLYTLQSLKLEQVKL
ncbi:MAG: DUF2460 domain-containing protein [Acidobacteriota bacterium]|nr:DUF2460 domain-containing protein [Acidobacteriota bacterium]